MGRVRGAVNTRALSLARKAVDLCNFSLSVYVALTILEAKELFPLHSPSRVGGERCVAGPLGGWVVADAARGIASPTASASGPACPRGLHAAH